MTPAALWPPKNVSENVSDHCKTGCPSFACVNPIQLTGLQSSRGQYSTQLNSSDSVARMSVNDVCVLHLLTLVADPFVVGAAMNLNDTRKSTVP